MSPSEPKRNPSVAQSGATFLSITFRLEHLVEEAPPSVPSELAAPDEYLGDTTTAYEPGDRDDAEA